jgi:hypothetical protein
VPREEQSEPAGTEDGGDAAVLLESHHCELLGGIDDTSRVLLQQSRRCHCQGNSTIPQDALTRPIRGNTAPINASDAGGHVTVVLASVALPPPIAFAPL